MEFEISLKALSVLRYITDCMDRWVTFQGWGRAIEGCTSWPVACADHPSALSLAFL